MNGSRISRLTPANARRTGNPSPSCPLGAVVTERTERECAPIGAVIRGRVKVSAVTAGMSHSIRLGCSNPQGVSLQSEFSFFRRDWSRVHRIDHGADGQCGSLY